MKALQTLRLILRPMTIGDGPFIFTLLNDPSFIQNIGDRGVRTVQEAEQYILTGVIGSYQRHGFGLCIVELKGPTRVPIGICGLVKRDTLPDPDLGFALMPAFWRQGYAQEASIEVLNLARHSLALPHVLAITHPENAKSISLLIKLGFRHQSTTVLVPNKPPVNVYRLDF